MNADILKRIQNADLVWAEVSSGRLDGKFIPLVDQQNGRRPLDTGSDAGGDTVEQHRKVGSLKFQKF